MHTYTVLVARRELRASCVSTIKRNFCIVPCIIVFFFCVFLPFFFGSVKRCTCAMQTATRFPPLSCFRFHLSRRFRRCFAERQHHLLFARSIYSANYIYPVCSLSRCAAVALAARVNCTFICFPPLFLSFRLSYRSQSGIPRSLRFHLILHLVGALRAGKARAHRPIASVKLSPICLKRNGKFSIRNDFLGITLICRGARAQARNNALSPPCQRRFSFQFYFAARARACTKENFTLHRLFTSLAQLLQSRGAVNSLLFAVTLPPVFPRCFIKMYVCARKSLLLY